MLIRSFIVFSSYDLSSPAVDSNGHSYAQFLSAPRSNTRTVSEMDSQAIQPGCPCCNYEIALAASRITSSTTLGWESMGTWLEATSTVLAPMRFAAKRSRSGWTVRSWVATMDQLGFDRQAMTSCFWVKRSRAGAKCVA